jgi:hypothetical protein
VCGYVGKSMITQKILKINRSFPDEKHVESNTFESILLDRRNNNETDLYEIHINGGGGDPFRPKPMSPCGYLNLPPEDEDEKDKIKKFIYDVIKVLITI